MPSIACAGSGAYRTATSLALAVRESEALAREPRAPLLAALYRHGRGVPRDAAKGVEWLERALPQDGLFAAFELGQQYAAGEGVPEDRRRAEELFRMALANGHPEARKALRLLGEGR